MSVSSKFATEILSQRTKLGLTQAQVAEAVNISTRWFQKIEKGERLPSTETALKLIAFLEINGKNLKEDI